MDKAPNLVHGHEVRITTDMRSWKQVDEVSFVRRVAGRSLKLHLLEESDTASLHRNKSSEVAPFVSVLKLVVFRPCCKLGLVFVPMAMSHKMWGVDPLHSLEPQHDPDRNNDEQRGKVDLFL